MQIEKTDAMASVFLCLGDRGGAGSRQRSRLLEPLPKAALALRTTAALPEKTLQPFITCASSS